MDALDALDALRFAHRVSETHLGCA
jgi:hypothetical protein